MNYIYLISKKVIITKKDQGYWFPLSTKSEAIQNKKKNFFIYPLN